MIRSMWLFGPFNKIIFWWMGAVDCDTLSLRVVEKDFLSGLISNYLDSFRSEMCMENDLCRKIQFQNLPLTICMHKGFLMVLDAESDRDLDAIELQLRKVISDAVDEEPLAFGQLLSDYDMPGRIKLGTRLRGILESQSRLSD
jgi:hypothetical protein